ncbi:hypothetical protein IFR09_24145 [Pseudomonas syringae]|nr:hypothetical protein [Pseudomonas syringae]MBD8575187.1 hypothetical protein [Pseudomonas syringae]MBD8788080.1 hypothetical protein [Pseudomonas syringae]MBD8799721.1 hypothetical protein [Pseudomonas syringae]MBD8814256.1 hypothetical protein [Pseudomonas syringae]
MSADMQLHVVASLLRRGRTLDNLSTGFTLLSLAVGMLQLWITAMPLLTVWLGTLVLLGLIEKYYAMRVAFDADLFQTLGSEARLLPDTTQALDQALIALGLQPADKAGRPWAVRSQGALRLLRRQLVLVAVQLLVLLGPLLVFPLLH